MRSRSLRGARALPVLVLGALALALPATLTRAAAPKYVGRQLVTSATDADLVNPWGIAFFPTHPFWISDNGTGLSTLYDGTGAKQGLRVTIPGPGNTGQGAPTGVVANATGQFQKDLFIFATEDGTIAGWQSGTAATIRVDNSGTGAVYKGLAIAKNGKSFQLYAADFHNGKIDVFDSSYNPVNSSGFTDKKAPAGYAPFNIALIGKQLFVNYAKQDAAAHDDVAGPGNGFTDVYTTKGKFVKRFASGSSVGGKIDALNSPWAIVASPGGFGKFSHDILVGNFGGGQIAVFNKGGHFLGTLNVVDTSGNAFSLDGLWGLVFGGAQASDPHTLYFTAGPNHESGGVFGSIATK